MTPRQIYPGKRDPVPIVHAPGPFSTVTKKFRPHRDFFFRFIFCTYCAPLYIYCPHVTYSSTTQNTNNQISGRIFLSCFLSAFCHTHFIIVLVYAFLPLLYSTHNTNIHASGGIRTRNSSKQATLDRRLKPLGIRSPDRTGRKRVALPTELSFF